MQDHRRALVLALAVLIALTAPGAALAKKKHGRAEKKLAQVNRIVVIYEENHSFDNLYGQWEKVEGLNDAPAARTVQLQQDGTPYACLPQNDVNLVGKLAC